VIGTPGLGSSIAVAQSSGALPKMYALIIVTGVIGVVVNLAARALERRSLHWHTSMRMEALA
jgi:ABC-type nitrate/sulfonate/bicarbonate transport system permease component